MCPSLIEIGSKTALRNSAETNKQTNKQTDRHYENNGHFAVNQKNMTMMMILAYLLPRRVITQQCAFTCHFSGPDKAIVTPCVCV